LNCWDSPSAFYALLRLRGEGEKQGDGEDEVAHGHHSAK
jgi:hypothetical protein